MEDINIKELFEFFISKLRIIILVTLVIVLVGAIYSLFFVEPEYKSTTTLLLTGNLKNNANNQKEDGASITHNDLTLNSELVSTYREIIKSKTVLRDVINTLDLDYSVEGLAGNITVATVSDAEMISITVKSKAAEETALIANELAVKFKEVIKEKYGMDNVSEMDRAEVPTIPTNVNIVKQIIIYILVGFVVASAIVLTMFYFDTSLKDANQIEKMGLAVLTSIPQKMEEGGKK